MKNTNFTTNLLFFRTREISMGVRGHFYCSNSMIMQVSARQDIRSASSFANTDIAPISRNSTIVDGHMKTIKKGTSLCQNVSKNRHI